MKIHRFRPALAPLFLGLVIALQPVFAAEVFVAPTGDDTAAGTLAQPFKTLERARDALRDLRAAHRLGAGESATIWLRGGTYPRTQPFELGPRDTGTANAPTIIAAYQRETVRLTGGQPVPAAAFSVVREPAVLARLPENARSQVVVADLRALGVKDFGQHRQSGHGLPVVPAPLEVYWNDEALPLARYPNKGAMLMGEVTEMGSVPRFGDYSKRPGKFKYLDDRTERWLRAPDLYLQGYFHHGYADDKIRVAKIEPATREITFAAPHMYGLGSGQNYNTYIALNLIEELDEPGEWYVDAAEGKLYLWPAGDLATARVVASIIEQPLVAIENTSHVHLRDLIIENGRGIGVYLEGGEYNRLTGCTVRNVGTVGIMFGQGARSATEELRIMDYQGLSVSREVGPFHMQLYENTVWERNEGTNHRVEFCEIYNTGSGGIILGGGSKKNLTPGHNVVANSRIHDFCRLNKSGAVGVRVTGCGNRVTQCEIYNGDLQAIFVHGNEHVFDLNHIHHVATNSNDASAWYLGRDPSDQGNVVRHNFFHDIGRPDRKWTMGVYCDDATCGVLVEGNVFVNVASFGSVYSNAGQDIVVRNNIFVDGWGPAFQLKSMWWDFSFDNYEYYWGAKSLYKKRLLEMVNIKAPPYSTHYPNLVNWTDLMPDGKTYVGMLPQRNIFQNNVLVNFEETYRLVGQHAQLDYRENFLSRKDPGFVDAKKLNYALRSDSAVWRALPNFQPIPFDQIGPRLRSEK